MNLEEGDWVKLVETHHAHKHKLKDHLGDKAKVTDVYPMRNKVLVRFDNNYLDRFWVKERWLGKLDTEED